MKPVLLDEELTVGTGAESTVLRVTREVSSKIGVEYFRAMSHQLAEALEADCVFIGEFLPGARRRVTTLAACSDGEQANLTFELAGSACSRIAATGKPLVCRKGARDRFPSDRLLS